MPFFSFDSGKKRDRAPTMLGQQRPEVPMAPMWAMGRAGKDSKGRVEQRPERRLGNFIGRSDAGRRTIVPDRIQVENDIKIWEAYWNDGFIEILNDIEKFHNNLQTVKLPEIKDPMNEVEKAEFIKKLVEANGTVMEPFDKVVEGLGAFSDKFKKCDEYPDKESLASYAGHLLMKYEVERIKFNMIVPIMMKAVNSEALIGRNLNFKKFSGISFLQAAKELPIYSIQDVDVAGSDAGGINQVNKIKTQQGDGFLKAGKIDVVKDKELGELSPEEANQMTTEEKELAEKQDTETSVFKDRLGYKKKEEEEDKDKYYEEDYKKRKILKNVHTAQRDVAVSLVNKLLGFDVIVSTELAYDKTGTVSSLMQKASGKSAQDFVFYSKEEEKEEAENTSVVKSLIDFFSGINGEEVKVGQIEVPKRVERKLAFNMSDESYANSLLKLSIVDIIVGHVDRHMGNYFVQNGSGGAKVTGIDNDTSFGIFEEISREKAIANGRITASFESLKFVPKKIFDNVMAVKPESLIQILRGSLSQLEIDCAVARLKALQEHLGSIGPKNFGPEEISQLANEDKEVKDSKHANYFSRAKTESNRIGKADQTLAKMGFKGSKSLEDLKKVVAFLKNVCNIDPISVLENVKLDLDYYTICKILIFIKNGLGLEPREIMGKSDMDVYDYYQEYKGNINESSIETLLTLRV